MNLEETI